MHSNTHGGFAHIMTEPVLLPERLDAATAAGVAQTLLGLGLIRKFALLGVLGSMSIFEEFGIIREDYDAVLREGR